MKEIIRSYYDVLELHRRWGKIPYSIIVSPEFYEVIKHSDIINTKYFLPNNKLTKFEFIEKPHGI